MRLVPLRPFIVGFVGEPDFFLSLSADLFDKEVRRESAFFLSLFAGLLDTAFRAVDINHFWQGPGRRWKDSFVRTQFVEWIVIVDGPFDAICQDSIFSRNQ